MANFYLKHIAAYAFCICLGIFLSVSSNSRRSERSMFLSDCNRTVTFAPERATDVAGSKATPNLDFVDYCQLDLLGYSDLDEVSYLDPQIGGMLELKMDGLHEVLRKHLIKFKY